jgi:metal-responsive CopG/Arc/MetJ family transcriptional regulator
MHAVNIATVKKRGCGRPRKTDALTTTIPVALSAALAERIDRWAAEHNIETRSGAVRALVEDALDRAEKRAAAPKHRKEK